MKRVVVVAFDAGWAEAFAREAEGVGRALGGTELRGMEVHHIGSTSIAGIWAKPVIDMLVVVGEIGAVGERHAGLVAMGYEGLGEFGIAGRRYFRKDDAASVRTHQIHVFEKGSPQVERHLAFRDFMRAHGEWARAYSDLKRRLAEAHPEDMSAYMDGKDGFIKEMDARAGRWRAGLT